MRNRTGMAIPLGGRRAAILGLGYAGRAIARRLMEAGWQVTGTARETPDMEGVFGLAFDTQVGASPDLREAVAGADLLVSGIPPDKETLRDPVLAAIPDLARLTRARVVYLGATSVYGDRDGGWAFEGEVPRPGTRRGLARVEAELQWLETRLAVSVLRLAGIYGPHDGVEARSPFLKLARAVVKPGHVVNRIHVDDVAELVWRVANHPDPERSWGMYNVADGHPTDPAEVVAHAARIAGAPEPERVTWTGPGLSPMARSFYAETKRIDISRVRAVFGWSPRFPTYQEGLAAIWAEREGAAIG